MVKTKASSGVAQGGCTFQFSGISPLSFGKAFMTPRESNEDYDVYENRVWRERCHVTSEGEVFVPPMMMKLAITMAASRVADSVPGKGSAKFGKFIAGGTLIVDPIILVPKVRIGDVQPERLYVNADGKRGGGTRVWRIFPHIAEWGGTCTMHIVDGLLLAHLDKVENYVRYAGMMIGLGRFAPRVGGYYGRFKVTAFEEC